MEDEYTNRGWCFRYLLDKLTDHTRSESAASISCQFMSVFTLPSTSADADQMVAQYRFNGPAQQRMSSPPVSGLPSSPALRASQRRHDHRPNQPRSTQHLLAESSALLGAKSNAGFQPQYHDPAQRAIALPNAPRTVQGTELRSTHELPDRFRSIFSFPNFNAMQSKCFDTLYRSNDNFVLSSPTGSGKTVAFELAICRLINGFSGGDFKIVYQAPTKSLCSERQRDWSHKFRPFDLECAELTGDTDASQLKNVQRASIIVTTPEKWDSMTRKWKDHIKLMKMIKLFLIDEVHILREERGAVLEVVVSRMKTIGSDVRFVALSASIPNSEDIATWLGKNPVCPQNPAVREVFGEEFRPVKLQKHVVGYQSNSNDFGFEKALDARFVAPKIPRFSKADQA
jgi:ATP-dependent DNA helicase HFM1/MER3